MSYFKDLEPCTAFPGAWNNLRAVGWLAKGHDFTRGSVEDGLFERIARVYWNPPGAPTGSHQCEFCGPGEIARVGHGAVFIPGNGVLYVAPGLLRHYVRKHGYQPPAAFLEAVRTCPQWPDYQDAVRVFLIEPQDEAVLPRPEVQILEGLEPIRRRPGMYIGSTDSRGLHHMVLEVVGNSFDQFLAGAATRITVDVDAQGWVRIEDDGRGMPVETIEAVFTTLHAGPTFDGHHPHVHVRSHAQGVGLGPVSALCARLEVETRRDGVAYRASFSCGRLVQAVQRQGETAERGTVIRLQPDDEIFHEGARLELEVLETALEKLAWLSPRLDLRLQGRSLQRREGLPGWVRHLAPEVVKETVLSAIGSVNDVDVEVALGWRPRGKEPLIRAFANYAETEEPASSNRQGVIAAVRDAIKQKRAAREKRVLSGLVAIVHVGLLHPKFGGPTRARLEMREAQVAVEQVVTRAINQAPWWWDRLHEAIG